MCLISWANEKTAETDVVCYKELLRVGFSGLAMTPVLRRWIGRRVLDGRRLYKARGKENGGYVGDGRYIVAGGFIHSYARRSLCYEGKRYVVYKCVIPAGTRYWKSFDGTEYASKSLRFVEKLG